jgi:cold-inducible RNA-binding protein
MLFCACRFSVQFVSQPSLTGTERITSINQGGTMKKIFIGNIHYAVSEQELQDWVASLGFDSQSAQIIRDRATGNSRGFAFVELAAEHKVEDAIAALNGRQMLGRGLTVNVAVPLTQRKSTAA